MEFRAYDPQNCMTVLLSIKDTPKSAKEIAVELNTHVSNIYRTLDVLQDHYMLIVSGNIFRHGRYRLFKSKYDPKHVKEKLQDILASH